MPPGYRGRRYTSQAREASDWGNEAFGNLGKTIGEISARQRHAAALDSPEVREYVDELLAAKLEEAGVDPGQVDLAKGAVQDFETMAPSLGLGPTGVPTQPGRVSVAVGPIQDFQAVPETSRRDQLLGAFDQFAPPVSPEKDEEGRDVLHISGANWIDDRPQVAESKTKVAAQTVTKPRPQAKSRRALSPEQYAIVKDLAPYVSQVQSARIGAAGRAEVATEREKGKARIEAMKMGGRILDMANKLRIARIKAAAMLETAKGSDRARLIAAMARIAQQEYTLLERGEEQGAIMGLDIVAPEQFARIQQNKESAREEYINMYQQGAGAAGAAVTPGFQKRGGKGKADPRFEGMSDDQLERMLMLME